VEEGFYKYALNSSNAELDEVIQELERELLNQLKSLYPARKLRNRDDSMRGL
jgi:transcriptional regulator of aromatic amino acid metabolism